MTVRLAARRAGRPCPPPRARWFALPLLLLCAAAPLRAADLEAGVARVSITPPSPFWMSGYAARTHRSEGVLQELWAKALALRDPRGQRVVLVSTDLIGLTRAISVEVAERAERLYGLPPSQLVLNSSHTHSGPLVSGNLVALLDLDEEDRRAVETYSAELTAKLVDLVGAALGDLAPARLDVGHGAVGFAVNRRAPTPEGFRGGVNPDGPVDHDVPVLRVTAPDGSLRAVLFGYACHNTTLGADVYQVNGDYAGHAQAELERTHPGATALFLMLCGGDQNPHPRGTLERVREYGRALAAEVTRVLGLPLGPVRPPIRSAFEEIRLPFAAHRRETFEQEAAHADRHRQRRARRMLAAYDRGEPVRDTPYPVQVIRLGQELTLVALGGEVVVDYATRLKREFPRENLIVAGYCRDVMGYVPSLRVLREGGYEAADSMIYYGQPGPFAESVEEDVVAAIRRLMDKTAAPDAEKIDTAVRSLMAREKIGAAHVTVLRGETVLLERGYGFVGAGSGPPDSRSIFPIGSISKQFSAATIVALADDGQLRLEAPVADYLPEWFAGEPELEVRHLLTHTSGITDFLWQEGYRALADDPKTPISAYIALASATPRRFEPGERWAYSNTNYKALALIAERVTGKPFDAVLAERVLRPAGIEGIAPCHELAPDAFVPGFAPTGKLAPLDASRAAYTGDGGLCASAAGLVDWVREGLVGRGGSPPKLARLAAPARLNSGQPVPYGFGLSTRELLGHAMIWHAGNVDGHSALIAHAPQDDLSIVILTNRGFVWLTELLPAWIGEPVPTRAPAAAVDPPLGRFDDGLFRYDITADGEQLVVAIDLIGRLVFVPAAANQLVARDYPATFRIRLPNDGSRDSFELDWGEVRSFARRIRDD